jgi:hypothetical protein
MNGLNSVGAVLSVDLDLFETGGVWTTNSTLSMDRIISNGSSAMLQLDMKNLGKIAKNIADVQSIEFLPIQFLESGIIKETDDIILVCLPALFQVSNTSHAIYSSCLVVRDPSRCHSQLERRNVQLLDIIYHAQTESTVIGHDYGRSVSARHRKKEGRTEWGRDVDGYVLMTCMPHLVIIVIYRKTDG